MTGAHRIPKRAKGPAMIRRFRAASDVLLNLAELSSGEKFRDGAVTAAPRSTVFAIR